MKLNRTAVIETIDEIEAARAQRHADAQQPRLDAWNAAVEEYRTNRAPELTKQLRALAEKAKKGTLITAQALTDTLGTSSNGVYFEPPADPTSTRRYDRIHERPTVTPYKPDSELAALRKILTDMTSDEFVTTSVLRELGFSPALFVKKQVTS